MDACSLPVHALSATCVLLTLCRRDGASTGAERTLLEAFRAMAPTTTTDKPAYATVTGVCSLSLHV